MGGKTCRHGEEPDRCLKCAEEARPAMEQFLRPIPANPTLCPTCGRRPSERVACDSVGQPTVVKHCPDPLHDLADRCAEMRQYLNDWAADWEAIAEAAGEKPDIMVTSLRGRIVNMRAKADRCAEMREALETLEVFLVNLHGMPDPRAWYDTALPAARTVLEAALRGEEES